MNRLAKTLAVVTSILGLVGNNAFAAPREFFAAVKVSVRCSDKATCGDDISLDQIIESYKNAPPSISKCVSDQTNSAYYRPNTSLSNIYRPDRCSSIGAIVDSNVCDSADTTGLYYFWAPVSTLPGGLKDFELLARRLVSGEPFDGYQVVEARDSPPNQRHIALCSVKAIKDKIGVPKNCTTVAVINGNEIWLRAGDKQRSSCYASATFRRNGSIRVAFSVETDKNVGDFVDNLLHLERGLGMEVEQEVSRDHWGSIESVHISGVSGIRNSPIISGWRDNMDLDIDIYSTGQSIEISGVIDTLVSQQNIANVSDMHGATDAQRDQYAKTLNQSVERAILSSCAVSHKIDDRQIVCKK
jgi:hypothetical protein